MNSQEPNFSAVMEKISNFEQDDFSLVVVDDKGNYHILGLKNAYSVNWLFSELFIVLKFGAWLSVHMFIVYTSVLESITNFELVEIKKFASVKGLIVFVTIILKW